MYLAIMLHKAHAQNGILGSYVDAILKFVVGKESAMWTSLPHSFTSYYSSWFVQFVVGFFSTYPLTIELHQSKHCPYLTTACDRATKMPASYKNVWSLQDRKVTSLKELTRDTTVCLAGCLLGFQALSQILRYLLT